MKNTMFKIAVETCYLNQPSFRSRYEITFVRQRLQKDCRLLRQFHGVLPLLLAFLNMHDLLDDTSKLNAQLGKLF